MELNYRIEDENIFTPEELQLLNKGVPVEINNMLYHGTIEGIRVYTNMWQSCTASGYDKDDPNDMSILTRGYIDWLKRHVGKPEPIWIKVKDLGVFHYYRFNKTGNEFEHMFTSNHCTVGILDHGDKVGYYTTVVEFNGINSYMKAEILFDNQIYKFRVDRLFEPVYLEPWGNGIVCQDSVNTYILQKDKDNEVFITLEMTDEQLIKYGLKETK